MRAKRVNGKGSLREVDGKYRVQVYRGKDPLTGKPLFESKRFTNLKTAETWLRDQAGTVKVSTRGTVGDVFDLWLSTQAHRHRAGKLSASTLDWYASGIEKHLRESLGSLPAAKVASAQLQRLIDSKSEGLGRSSLRRLTIILRAVFAYAVSEGLIERNPALRLEVPDVSGSSVERVWTVDQVKAFLTDTADTPLGPLWWLLAVTGLRRGEALGLNWEDVTFPDIGSPSIEIRRAYVNVKGKAEYGPLKTGRSARRFTIDNDTASLLAAIRDRQKADYGQDWKPSFPVFTRPDLKPVNPNYVTREFQATAARLKLPAIGPHGLRHSLATALGEEGVSLLVVSRLLGHSSTRVTADVYSHTFAETAGNAVALVAGRLRPA